MPPTKRLDHRGSLREADADRRRLLLAIVGLPLAAQGATWLAGCSSGDEARAPDAPAAGAAPAAPAPTPTPAAPPAEAPAAPEPAPETPSAGSGAAKPAGDSLVTEVEAMRPTVQALQYVNESTRPDQRCTNCQFYTAKSAERGSCQLFPQGLVTAEGWCSSWTKRTAGE